jgi:cellulose synthase/poly-beta-1,6-N-acetylglucosamine synthase-like glycosyltransferase
MPNQTEFQWFQPRAPDDDQETLVLPKGWLAAPHRRIVALVPAHNEAADIAATIESLLHQTRKIDDIVVVSDNSTDATVDIACMYDVTVLETVDNTRRKSGALNYAWHTRAREADIVVCIDGDTQLPKHAVADWEREFAMNPQLGGSSSQPIMTGYGFLPRLQRFEFSKSVQMSLARGWCRVVSGTGCAYRGAALREAARRPGQAGPWTYESVVEDYHLTYRMRQAGWHCEMSPTVWCWTGSMTSIKSLWYQRIKWQAGTCGDLLRFGCNRLNWREWGQQVFMLLCIAFWVVWLSLNGTQVATGGFHFNPFWQCIPLIFAAMEMIHVRMMPERDWKDYLLAGFLVQMTVYAILATSWGTVSWIKVIREQMGDLWAPQYRAEGMAAEEMKIGV